MIKGKKVQLGPIEKQHLSLIQYWRNQPELRRVFREYRELTIEHQNKWYESKVLNDPSTVMFMVYDSDMPNATNINLSYTDKHPIGVCGLCYIDYIHRKGEFSIYIGEDYAQGGGRGSEALRILCHYGFEILNLNKIWGEVYSLNQARLDTFLRIGFVPEGLLRETYYYQGKYYDSNMIGLLRSDYEKSFKDSITKCIEENNNMTKMESVE